MEEVRPMRADAIRNRARILEAAREQIAAHGTEIGMDEIAAAAGVAVGTLYRHFPTKADLAGAVIRGYVEAVADDVEATLQRVHAGAPAVEELIGFLDRALRSAASHFAVKSAASRFGEVGLEGGPAEARAAAALTRLLAIGQQEERVRAGITVEDIYLLISTAPVDQSQAALERWFALMLPGILR